MAGMTPLAYASSIIGIISFFFTLSIFFNAFAQAWDTVLGAPVQITDYLGNLREELYEEKEALKRARARPHGYRLKILDDSVKDILREFRRIERPFLPSGRRGSKRRRAKASVSASGGEKGVEEEEEEDFKAKAPGFYVCDWRHRVIWLQTKSAAVRLATVLDRLQTRRIERELSDVHLIVQGLDRTLRRLDDRLWGVEDRLRISHVSVQGQGQGGSRRDGERFYDD